MISKQAPHPEDLTTTTKSDSNIYIKNRILANFLTTGIPDIHRLSLVEYNQARIPLEPHVHAGAFEICYHLKGKQTYVVEDRTYTTHGGDLFITYPDEVHGTGSFPEEKSALYYVIFSLTPQTESLLGMSKKDTQWIKDTLYSCQTRVIPGNDEIPRILAEILDIFFSDQPMWEIRLRALWIQFFYQVCQCILSANTSAAVIPDDIAKIVENIRQKPELNYSITDMAADCCLSESQFKRKFKKYTGIPPGDYVLQEKIRRAKSMIQEGQLNLTDISMILGFSSSQYFSTVFKKYTGLSPSVFKQQQTEKQSG